MKSIHVATLIVLTIVILFLSLWGAGVFIASLCISASLLCLAASALTLSSKKRQIKMPIAGAIFSIAILLLGISAIPLPGESDILTGAKRYGQNLAARDAIVKCEEVGLTKKITPHFSISRNRSGTLRIILLMTCMMCSMYISAMFPQSWKRKYMIFLVLLMTLVAVLGYLHQWIIPMDKTIWWLFKVPHGKPVGAFINRTHHAGLIAMLCPSAIALVISEISMRKTLSIILFSACFIAMSFAVFTSLSRGAVLAWAIGVTPVLLFSVFRNRARKWLIASLIGFTLLSSVGILVTGLTNAKVRSAVTERLETLRDPASTDSGQTRISIWYDSIDMWLDYPWTGVGANAFRSVFPIHNTRTDRKPFSHSENEYVSIIVETGIIGMILSALIIYYLLRQITASSPSNESTTPVTGGCIGAILVAAFHNSVDFPLHAPLYAIILCTLLGMLAGAGDNVRSINVHRRAVAGMLAGASVIIFICLLIYGTTPYRRDNMDVMSNASTEELCKTLEESPTSFYVWQHLGVKAFNHTVRDSIIFSEQCVIQAIQYNPNSYLLWEDLGHKRMLMGDKKGAEKAFKRMQQIRPWKKIPKLNTDKY